MKSFLFLLACGHVSFKVGSVSINFTWFHMLLNCCGCLGPLRIWTLWEQDHLVIFISLSTHVKTQGHRLLSHQYQHFVPDTWPLLQPMLSTHQHLFKTNWYIPVSKSLPQYISFTPVCLYKSDLQAHFTSVLFRRSFHFIPQDSLLTHLFSV